MPDSMEKKLVRLLEGLSLDENIESLCDFTLAEQNAASEAQGIQPNTSPNFIPVVGQTVTYIVACVLVNSKNEVLMMQEAKESCAGKWYLPAGRMEVGETIEAAAKREVLEETGLEIQPTTLLCVECAGGSWIRFVLTGEVVGGDLKTPQKADSESLQARWVENLAELSLRSSDIMHIIEISRNYANRGSSEMWHKEILPSVHGHDKSYLRLVVAIRKRSNNKVHVLLSEKNSYHFPTVELHPGRSVHSTLRKFMIELFGAEVAAHRPHGVLSVEHSPITDMGPDKMRDGICLTVLVSFRPPLEEVSLIGKCVWHELTDDLGRRLHSVVISKNATIALHVVR